MPLTPGQTLTSYEIVAHLGKGGMGEVYRARDTKLGREVAIKVLPEDLADNAERLARFEREAKTLASLNHANIATVFGFEAEGDTRFLVMELVAGQTLAEQLAPGPVDITETLQICRQIAEALEAAHERGIIHRDLKPANVMVTPEGRVKVLDFGLAKATGSTASGDAADSPTITADFTRPGTLLGTAAYMSPEQARGRQVDKRADIWAFGCVLYELLAGQRAFEGEDTTEMLAAIVKDTPDWDRLPSSAPASVVRLLHRCLQKDPRSRLHDIADARIEIDEGLQAPEEATSDPATRVSGWQSGLPWQWAGFLAVAVIALFAWSPWVASPASASSAVSKLSIELGGRRLEGLALSPDGSQIVFAAAGNLYLRPLSVFDATRIAGTESIGATLPEFSPDGLLIAFTVGSTLMRVPVSGGAVVAIGDVGAEVTGLSWSDDDHLLVAVGDQGILRMPAVGGGAPEQLVTMQAGEHAASPQLMPGGDAVLFTLATGSPEADWNTARLVLQSLGSDQRDPIGPGSDGRYLDTGHLVYAIGGIWFAVAFDRESRQRVGAPVSMVEGISRSGNRGLLRPGANVRVSNTGVLVYQPGPSSLTDDRLIVLTDRSGRIEPLGIVAGPYESPRISPDGHQLALSTNDAGEAAVWVYDMSGQSALRPLTFTGRNRLPVWSPDSQRLAFQSDRDGDASIFVQRADGSGGALRLTTAESGTVHVPESWSSDGRYLSLSILSDAGAELWLHTFADGKMEAFGDVRARFPLNSAFSPDGRWIAYTLRIEDDTGVWVQPVPATDARYRVSLPAETGHHPFWAPNGEELFYFGLAGGLLVSVPITLTPTVRWDVAVRIPGDHPANTTGEGPLNNDITPDGRRLVSTVRPLGEVPDVGAEQGPGESLADLRVVQNWFEELKVSVPIR